MNEIKTTAKKWGSSIGIIIPKEIVEKEKIKEGEKLDILIRKRVDLKKTKEAWRDMQKLSKEISKKWKGPSVVEEIRDQRTKK